MRRLRIQHTTNYTYSNSVTFQPHTLLIRPREGADVRIESSRLNITPAHIVKWHRDPYDNNVAITSFQESAAKLAIESEVIVQHYDESPFDFLVAESAVQFPFHYDPAERLDLIPYFTSVFPEDSQALRDWLMPFWRPGQLIETYVLLDHLVKAIANTFTYQMREMPGVQSPAMTLAQQSGSCRDFATLLMETCRFIGLGSRFVSGYLHAPATEIGPGSTHAWAEIYLPGAGWKGFDPTIGEIVGPQHIPVAVHRHPEAVPPITGSFVGQLSQPPYMEVDVRVQEISPAPVA